MIDNRKVYCVAKYENRSFLGALIYLYRLNKGVSMDKLLSDLKIDPSQKAYIQRIEKSPKLTNENIKPILEYLGITDDEINSYPNINSINTNIVFKIKELPSEKLGVEEICKELEISKNTCYKLKKVADKISNITEEEATSIFAELYFNTYECSKRNALFYIFFCKNNVNRYRLAKQLNTSSQMIYNLCSGKKTPDVKLLERKFGDLYGDRVNYILSTYE